MAIIIGAILLCGINYIVGQIFGSWFGYSYEFFFIFWALLGGFLGYLTRRVKRQEETLHKLGSTVYDLQQQLKAALQRPAFEVPASTTDTAVRAAALATAAPNVDQKTILIPEEALQPEMQPGIKITEAIEKPEESASVVFSPPVEETNALPETFISTRQADEENAPPTAMPQGISPEMSAEEASQRGRITGRVTGKTTSKITGKLAEHLAEQAEKIKASQGPSRVEQILSAAGNDAAAWVRNFIFGGNLLVKIGGLVFFLGLSFLLRYAAGSGLLPVELRYAAVAIAGIGLLAFGWRLREKRPAYALVLQGVAVGTLYLTLFASMKMHDLLPVVAGFGLMVLVCITAAILAVRQNALSLAVAASLGGFATPVLLSSGGGSHVALFSYLLLLNVGIAIVAWFRAWRVLNLIGFVATFGLFSAWVSRSFMLEHWQSAEVFLWAFFILFAFILLRTSHHLKLLPEEEPENDAKRDAALWNAKKRADMVDGSLTFALPLAAFGIHIAMSEGMEFAGAFAALGMGAFYIMLTAFLKKRWGNSSLLLNEAFLSLGVVFASLAIPLALDSHWTTASWALEAAGIYWVGLRQHRPLARGFATLLLFGAIVSFMQTLDVPYYAETVWLNGSALGALLIAASALFIHLQITRFATANASSLEQRKAPWLAVLAIVFFALLPPLLLSRDNSIPVWALMGVLTVFLSLKTRLKHGLWAGFLLQFLAGIVFVLTLDINHLGETGLESGWHGLFVALIIGGALLMAYRLVNQSLRETSASSESNRALSLFTVFALLGALVFFNITPLFVFPLLQVLPAWAVSACLALALSMKLERKSRTVILYFTLALIALSALIFIGQSDFYYVPWNDNRPAFWHQQWWTMIVFSLAGFGSAWLLYRGRMQQPENAPALPDSALFIWGAMWWYSAWSVEIYRLSSTSAAIAWMVLLLSATALVWLGMKRLTSWQTPWLATFSHLPLCAALLLALLAQGAHPLQNFIGATWLIAALTHFVILYCHDKEKTQAYLSIWHMVGLWWLLVLVSSELRWQMASIGDQYSAWPKLGWAIFPLAYLWCAALWQKTDSLKTWPLSLHRETYCIKAALPVAGYMVLWVLFGNVISSGEALPLPYLPIINPLEIAFAATLLALFFWARQLPAQVSVLKYMPWGIGMLALWCLTGTVFRTVHHLIGVPWYFDLLLESMILQVGLSITWGLAACLLMIIANKKHMRLLWIAGSVLMALVVLKLFIVELSHSNTLERIISFIVVGVLLLGLGYFAPIPPASPASPGKTEGQL